MREHHIVGATVPDDAWGRGPTPQPFAAGQRFFLTRARGTNGACATVLPFLRQDEAEPETMQQAGWRPTEDPQGYSTGMPSSGTRCPGLSCSGGIGGRCDPGRGRDRDAASSAPRPGSLFERRTLSWSAETAGFQTWRRRGLGPDTAPQVQAARRRLEPSLAATWKLRRAARAADWGAQPEVGRRRRGAGRDRSSGAAKPSAPIRP